MTGTCSAITAGRTSSRSGASRTRGSRPWRPTMPDLTPDVVAELKRLLDQHRRPCDVELAAVVWLSLAGAAIEALPALLAAVEDRDRLQRIVEADIMPRIEATAATINTGLVAVADRLRQEFRQ